MKKYGFNPYLPFWENVPDGEPHVFEDRLYIYGSHDRCGGKVFCELDYVCWSAPVDDLADWRYEGVIYTKAQDPINGAPYDKELPKYDSAFSGPELHNLYAPDVAQGPDGRYYLFYALDFVNVISVAVSDTPAGKYEFLAYVTREDGSLPEVGRYFDPAILCEKSGNYLYYGFCPPVRFPGMEALDIPGAMMVKLADDMHTMITEPVCVANGCDTCKGTDYEEHPFFEASSIRHFGDWYYFVYSSLQGHELCYGMATAPEGPFAYKGVIHSNCDLGYEGSTVTTNYYGNNHGGLVQVGEKYYIFGHRQTHGTGFSRQGVAEEVKILADGTIPQVEQTSCGLNAGPLPAKDSYPSYIYCHLTEKDRSKVGHVVEPGPGGGDMTLPEQMPYLSEEPCEEGEHGLYPFICNLREGSTAGFKYFRFDGDEKKVRLCLRGHAAAEICLDPEGKSVAATVAVDSDDWTYCEGELSAVSGVHSVYLRVKEGRLDFAEIGFA